MIIRASLVSVTSFGMNLSRGIIRSTTGCRPPTISRSKPSVIVGPHVPLARGDFGERREHVELGERRARRTAAARSARPIARAQRLEQLALARLDALGRRQHPLLVLLERRRHVALGARQRLAPLVVGGNEVPCSRS